MGFRPEPTLFTLKFEDDWLNGLIVKVGCCTVREFNTILLSAPDDEKDVSASNTAVLNLFLKYLSEWNLESFVKDETHPEGEWIPTPHTVDGVETHERRLIRTILVTWQKAMAGIDDDLGKDSMSGNTSLEESLGLGGV